MSVFFILIGFVAGVVVASFVDAVLLDKVRTSILYFEFPKGITIANLYLKTKEKILELVSKVKVKLGINNTKE